MLLRTAGAGTGSSLRDWAPDTTGDVPLHPGTLFADSVALDPVARLWGDLYAMIGETPSIPRPAV